MAGLDYPSIFKDPRLTTKASVFCSALLLFSRLSAADSLIPNGGLTGFQSDYTTVDSSVPYGCYGPSTVALATSTSPCHDLWVDPSGSDPYLLFNGGTETDSLGQVAWRYLLTDLDPNTSYRFSAQLANVCCNFSSGYVGPLVSFWINGLKMLDALTDGPGVWDQFAFDFSGASNVTIELGNDQLAYNGNDFAGKDFALSPVPEPASMILLGSGLIGVARIIKTRRRKP